jgi:orotidine-5'-phosphate decarboxylase
VLGLDPDPAALWPGVGEEADRFAESLSIGVALAERAHIAGSDSPARGAGSGEPPSSAARAAGAVLAHCLVLIDAAAPACVAVKPQLARFEVLGAPGRAVLGAVVHHAHEAGLLVIADAKRGDIDVTAQAYADSLFGGLSTPFGVVSGLGADLVTVNPLMGADAVAPFVSAARTTGAGVLALVRTSNPGAVDVEDLELAGGGTVWERLARMVDELGRPGVGEAGLSDVGAVVGATVPAHLARARELMPHAIFLLPGVGAQGGRVEDLAPAFQPGRAGGLISASRSIAAAHKADGGDPAACARAEAERLRAVAWGLG